MSAVLAQLLPGPLFEMAFTAALVVGGLLFVGAIVSFAVYGYKSLKGDGMADPREVAPEKAGEDEDGLTKGGSDDEWDYY